MQAQTSALVASEWYMRNNFFPGWGRPYEFASELFTKLNRDEEARDMARCVGKYLFVSTSIIV